MTCHGGRLEARPLRPASKRLQPVHQRVLHLVRVGIHRGGRLVLAAEGLVSPEAKLEEHRGNLTRAAVELAKDWRSDRILRKLEALLAVANKEASLIITGNGDVIQPEDDLIAIGSGGPFAQSGARALLDNTDLDAKSIVEKGLEIAGDICIYTNHNRTIEELDY